jgi:cytoskeleton protein RodZ
MADSESQDAPAAPAAPETLGQRLRTARLAHDLTLEQLATELRIEAKQLEALEEDRFERIGVPVFVKGYLKQYGTRLGLSVPDLLVLYYKQTTLGDVQIQPSRTIKLHDERQITSWVLAAILLLAVVVGLAIWWWNGGGFQNATQPAGAPSSPESAAPADSLSPGESALVAAPTSSNAPPAVEIGAEPAVAPAQAPDSPSEAVPLTANLTPAEAALVTSGSDTDRAAPVVAIPLEFTFDAENWVEVSDGRGQRVLFGFQSAGRTVTVRGEPPFAVVLGNADSVRLVVDGAPFTIPTAGRQGNVARFSVDIAEE